MNGRVNKAMKCSEINTLIVYCVSIKLLVEFHKIGGENG